MNNMNNMYRFLVVLVAFFYTHSIAQFTYPGCSDLSASEFKAVSLFTLADGDPDSHQPTQMDFVEKKKPDSTVYADIYVVERFGAVKYYNGLTGEYKKIGTIPNVRTNGDHGLNGVAVDKNFEENGYLYVYYSADKSQFSDDTTRQRISRFTVTNETLPLNTEKIILEWKSSNMDQWHHGGPMAMDAWGNLWAATGNDSPDQNDLSHLSTTDRSRSDEWGSSNTASMRGSILRIHPDEAAENGYSIPENNFAEYWANQFENDGETALAEEYRNPEKVLPEIYTKGHRSNYSVTVDPHNGYLTWGEVNGFNNDEYNLVKHPVFAGYPYWEADADSRGGNDKDPLKPINNSPFNYGVQQLPPHEEPTWHISAVAITGPIYKYMNINSPIKFPPHLDKKWFVGNWRTNASWVKTVTLDENHEYVRDDDLFTAFTSSQDIYMPLDIEMGPDGALYVLNAANPSGWFDSAEKTGITRIEYTGDCHPDMEGRDDIAAVHSAIKPDQLFTITGNRIHFKSNVFHSMEIYTLSGKRVANIQGTGIKSYPINEYIPQQHREKLLIINLRAGEFSGTYKLAP